MANFSVKSVQWFIKYFTNRQTYTHRLKQKHNCPSVVCRQWMRVKPDLLDVLMYPHKDDHVPDGFDQDDVQATLAQLFVLGEADLKQSSRVLQLLHFHLHRRHWSITLENISACCHTCVAPLIFFNHSVQTTLAAISRFIYLFIFSLWKNLFHRSPY